MADWSRNQCVGVASGSLPCDDADLRRIAELGEELLTVFPGKAECAWIKIKVDGMEQLRNLPEATGLRQGGTHGASEVALRTNRNQVNKQSRQLRAPSAFVEYPIGAGVNPNERVNVALIGARRLSARPG